jgi:sulfate adenylyltransferase
VKDNSSGVGGRIPRPHGGKLVNRHSATATAAGNNPAAGMFVVQVGNNIRDDIENIADGIFSPLEGFLNREDLESVLESGSLKTGVRWTVPIVLDVDHETAMKMKESGEFALANGGSGGELENHDNVFATMKADDIYTFDKITFAKSVYGTDDPQHPGVKKTFSLKDWLVGGKINLVRERPESSLRKFRKTPAIVRDEISRRGWKSMVGFQTRNVPHVAHEMLQKTALNLFDGLFVNPLIGPKKSGDFRDEVIISAYRELIQQYYPEHRTLFSTLHTEMRYAGPKEAIHHAIMRKNFGCSHFIVGRDHAGVGNYYHPFAAQKIFAEYPELEIEPLFFPAFYYCKRCLAFASERNCPHGQEEREELSGTKMRKMVSSGEIPPKHLMRPEVAKVILSYGEPFV